VEIRKMWQEDCRELNIDTWALKQWDFDLYHIMPRGKVIMLETDRGTKCLKIVQNTEHEVFHLFLLLEHLAQQGFKKVPRLIRTKFGEPYHNIGNRYYCISDWIDGRPIDLRDQNDVSKAIRQLARLHQAAKGLILPMEKEASFDRNNWKRDFIIIAVKLEELMPAVTGPPFLKQSLRMMASQAVISYRMLERAGYHQFRQLVKRELSFCHGAYHSHHVIASPSGEIFITGFDGWQRDLRLRDLVDFIRLVGSAEGWNSPIASQIIPEYAGIYPLDAAEIEIIQANLWFPVGYWQLLKQLAQENSALDQTRERMDSFLRQEEEKQKYLAELTQWVERRSC